MIKQNNIIAFKPREEKEQIKIKNNGFSIDLNNHLHSVFQSLEQINEKYGLKSDEMLEVEKAAVAPYSSLLTDSFKKIKTEVTNENLIVTKTIEVLVIDYKKYLQLKEEANQIFDVLCQ